jgi:alpha-1,6-mannosyltransferase
VLVKYVPVIFLPAQLIYLWHTRQSRSRLALYLALGFLIGGALAVLLYEPFSVGLRTFEGVRLQGQPLYSPSPSGLLYRYLSLAFSQGEAARLTLRVLAGAFVVFVLLVSWRVRDAAGMLGTCASIALAYVLVVSAHYWPWYASLPLALMALRPGGVFLPAALALTLCSRLVAPLSTLFTNGFMDAGFALNLKMAVGVTIPFLILLLLCYLQWLRGRAPEKQ